MKAETERLIGRLMSSDPDFDDCTDAANLLRRYYRDSHGPDGLPWKDAAVSERVRRVAVEQQNAELREALEGILYIQDCCDETGYVDGVGFVDIDSIVSRACKALARPIPGAIRSRGGCMSDSAKVFHHEEYGQIVVIQQASDDDHRPELRFFSRPPGLWVCAVSATFADSDAGWDKCDEAFSMVTRDNVGPVVAPLFLLSTPAQ